MLGVEPVHPRHLLRTGQLGVGLVHQRQEEFGMGPPRRLCFAALLQPLQPVLPNRLQHGEAWLAIRPLDRLQQVVLDQSVQTAEDVELLRIGHHFHCPSAAPPAKTASRW